MTKWNFFLGTLAAGMLAFAANGAQAVIVLENWDFHASGVDGLPASASYDTPVIDEWTFVDHFVQHIDNDVGPAGFSVGDEGVVDGVGVITSMRNDGLDVSSPLLNVNGFFMGFPGYEVTFEFHVDYVVTDVDGNDINFVHTTANHASGELRIYVDNLGNLSQCSTLTGLGCTDGTLVAIFDILDGDGGVINFVTFDGSDDATFAASYLAPGVWSDDLGNDLACNNSVAGEECVGELSFTDSNLDSDPENDNLLNTTSSVFNCGIDPDTGQSGPTRNCGNSDGSFVRATVPEPATLALFSLGLVAVGGVVGYRRRRSLV